MSNLIKYSFVNFNDKDAVVINHDKEDKFTPMEPSSHKVVARPLDELANEDALETSEQDLDESSFSQGMSVVNFDKMFAEKQKEAEQLAEKILSETKSNAAMLLEEAQKDAESVRKQAYEEGISAGKLEGLEKAEEETASIRAELEQERMQQEKDYQDILSRIEPQYVEVVCSLLQKLTGIIVSDQKDVLLHLVRSGIQDMDPAKRYTIRVSPEDALTLETKKNEIIEKIGMDAIIEIQEEKGLEKDECIIETDTQMVDCGFRTQLNNLMNTLRMLAQ